MASPQSERHLNVHFLALYCIMLNDTNDWTSPWSLIGRYCVTIWTASNLNQLSQEDKYSGFLLSSTSQLYQMDDKRSGNKLSVTFPIVLQCHPSKYPSWGNLEIASTFLLISKPIQKNSTIPEKLQYLMNILHLENQNNSTRHTIEYSKAQPPT